jgi:SAM-dependent methyltransferase
MGNSWFETFFAGVATDCWRKCVTPEMTKAETDFIADALHLEPPAKILDIACGNGRHSIELARLGYAMTGLDISEESISEALEVSGRAGVDVEWIRGDMRRLSHENAYDGAFSFGNSFGYLEHDETMKFLAALGRALRPKARFILQTGAVAECLLPRFREREWYQIQDILFAEENRYRIEESRVETDYTFVRGGRVEVRPGVQCIYTTAEIGRMLRQVGLKVLEIFSSLRREPATLGCDQLFFVAEKTV